MTRVKREPNQLPLICEECGKAPIEVTEASNRVIVRCMNPGCGITRVALIISAREDPDPEVIRQIEAALLSQVSETARTLYEYLKTFLRENGYAPTVRDMQTAMGWNSPTNVTYHLKQLEAVGLIERGFAAARAIRLLHAA